MSAAPKLTMTVYAGDSTPAKLTAAFMDALQRVEARQLHDGTSTFRMVLSVQRPNKLVKELPIISEGTVGPGKRVKVAIELNSVSQCLVDGVVTHEELVYDPDHDEFTYAVIGEDLSVYMDLTEVADEWPGRSSAAIVGEILDKYAKYSLSKTVIAPAADYTPTVKQWIRQQNATDLKYLRSLGAAFDHVFAIRPGETISSPSMAYWGPPSRDATPMTTSLAVGMGATGVKSIDFNYDATAAAAAKGGSRVDADSDQTMQVQSSTTLAVKKLAKVSSLDSPLAKTRRFIRPNLSGTIAGAFADAQAQGSARAAARVHAVIDGFVYGDVVTPAALLPVRGTGAAHDGLYYVERVEHGLERGSYTQDIIMTREGPGATISRAS